MCGISGVYNPQQKEIFSINIIKKIINLQKKRGPDADGLWRSKCNITTFGHNRLSIIDLSENAKQPFISQDTDFVITFNGEIYNYKEIRDQLIKKNIIFKSNSDTEVILESYKYWGLDFLRKIRGMFSFAIWDNLKKKMILARDPFGIKPLYYCKVNNIFYFASEIRSLLSIDNLKFSKSNLGLVSYYLWGNVQEPHTLYNEIKSLEKGKCLVLSQDSDQLFDYANIRDLILNTEKINFKDHEDKNDYLKNIVDETVNYHHVSDVPRTLLLSSGIDSNVILSAMSEETKKNCSALTLDFNYKGKENESFLAKESAKINNISHNSLNITGDEFNYLVDNFFKDMDSPTNDGFNNYLISYLAKKNGSKIIISGLGGDEFFSGYPSFKFIPRINNALKYTPDLKFLNSFFINSFYPFLKKKKMNTKYSGIFEYGKKLNSAFLLKRSLFLPHEISELMSKSELDQGFEELDFMNSSSKEINEIKDKKLAIMYMEIKFYLCSKLLKDSDWASMAHSIELRTPFVDWFFFKKLIPLLKFDTSINKDFLYECFKSKLPKDLQNRDKTGFVVPHEEYLNKLSIVREYKNPLKDWGILSYIRYLENV